MVRKAKFIPAGLSKLSQLIASLNAPPRLTLPNLKSLRLTLAFQNDHFGARCAFTSLRESMCLTIVISSHFVKEQLPRIQYANPTLDIQVEKVRKTAQEAWRPQMELDFSDSHPRFLYSRTLISFYCSRRLQQNSRHARKMVYDYLKRTYGTCWW